MTTRSPIANALQALGHDARLTVFRLLVRAGDGGLSVGQIASQLDLAPSTLAHHLRSLVSAGLVVQEKSGREITSRVDFAKVRQTVEYLTSECCSGVKLTDEEEAA